MKEFDYYIFIDYSENLIGYIIIKKENVKELCLRLAKIKHYKKVRHAREYLPAIKRRFEKEGILNFVSKHKIRKTIQSQDIFIDIIDFIKKNEDSKFFISVDNHHFFTFKKLFDITKRVENIVLVMESKLKRFSAEYQLNLIIDNLLSIERKDKSK